LADRATVVAIADPHLGAAEARADRFGILHVFASVEAMLDRVGMDALDVAAPREFHPPICRMAARRGLDTLCQKPLAPTLAEARTLARELDGKVRLMVHENWRFRPHYRQIHSWLREGRIGDVRTASMRILTSGLLPDETGTRPALVRQPMMAGLERMLLMEVMIHHVDALRFLLGPLELHAARLGKTCQEIAGEDRASLFMTNHEGAAVSLMGDFMAHGHPPQQFDHLEIFGSEGAVFLQNDTLRLMGKTEASLTIDLQANYKASYRGAISHFLDRLADGAPFETGPEDNLKTLEIVESAYATGVAG